MEAVLWFLSLQYVWTAYSEKSIKYLEYGVDHKKDRNERGDKFAFNTVDRRIEKMICRSWAGLQRRAQIGGSLCAAWLLLQIQCFEARHH